MFGVASVYRFTAPLVPQEYKTRGLGAFPSFGLWGVLGFGFHDQWFWSVVGPFWVLGFRSFGGF